MKRLLSAITLVLAACAPPNSGPTAVPSATFPFHAVGRNVSGTVIEELFGEARVYDNEIHVVVLRGFAALQTTATRRPIGLSAGLAYRHPNGGWDFRRESPTVPITALKVRGDTLLAPVEFRLTGTRGLELSSHWIVIQQHRYTLVAQDGQWHEATRPIDSDANVFKVAPR
jgi:hypothetical protein